MQIGERVSNFGHGEPGNLMRISLWGHSRARPKSPSCATNLGWRAKDAKWCLNIENKSPTMRHRPTWLPHACPAGTRKILRGLTSPWRMNSSCMKSIWMFETKSLKSREQYYIFKSKSTLHFLIIVFRIFQKNDWKLSWASWRYRRPENDLCLQVCIVSYHIYSTLIYKCGISYMNNDSWDYMFDSSLMALIGKFQYGYAQSQTATARRDAKPCWFTNRLRCNIL